MTNLFNFINKKIILDELSSTKIRSFSSEKMLKKGESILYFGNHCKHLYFINEGLVKFCFDTNKDEFIMRFFGENSLFTELESLTTGQASKYQIIALEDTQYIQVSYAPFKRFCSEDPKIGQFFNELLTRAHINMMNRISEMLESNATVRYQNFIEQNGNIVNRITLGDLSKYLGINQVTLSRIRHKK
jgi:CRP-like cAMP-binding protein